MDYFGGSEYARWTLQRRREQVISYVFLGVLAAVAMVMVLLVLLH